MGDELNQTNESEDSNEAKIACLLQEVNELRIANQVLWSENLEKAKQIEDVDMFVTYFNGVNNSLRLQIKTLEEEKQSNLSRIDEYDYIIDFLHDKLTSTTKEKDDQLTSIREENNALRSVNDLLAKRLQKYKKDLSDSEKITDDFIDKKAKIEDMKLQNEKLKSELENVKLQKEISSSDADKLMVLYQCSEREKYIASMKLLDTEENIRRLRNELQSLQNFMASQNEAERHSNKSNGGNVQASKLIDFDVESELVDIAHALFSIKDDNTMQMEPVNESENSETSATQSIKKDIRFLQEEILTVTRKADEFYEKFEAKFEEKRSCLMTKLTSCDDQILELKKLCVKLKREKLVLLDTVKEMNDFLPNYSEQLGDFQDKLAKGAEEAGMLRMKTVDFEKKVKSVQQFTREMLR